MAISVVSAMALTATSFVAPVAAASGDRTIYLYYTHTKETAKITFKRGGRYDKKGLEQLNYMLRDWRRNEPTKMDPRLFDLVWEVYQESGATKPVHVVSAYRAPATNEMLRSKSNGVAKNSRHTMGMAMDFYIPGVKISKLRALAMKKQIGGVGYYPTSGNPFVHLDTGSVRAWPRMTRAQLKKVFPDGKTMHVPNDGVPLSKSGYQYAKAQWNKCHAVPCNGRTVTRSTATTRVASSSSASDDGAPKQTLLGWLFGGDENEAEDTVVTRTAANTSSSAAPRIPTEAPTPFARPLFAGTVVSNAPFPAARPASLTGGQPGAIAVAAIEENTTPTPRALFSRPGTETDTLLTAYAPSNAPIPASAQPVARELIASSGASAQSEPVDINNLPELDPVTFETASISGSNQFDALGSLINSTWTAVANAGNTDIAQSPDFAGKTIITRRGVFHAPDLDHVTEIFTDPLPMTGPRYAVIFEHDEADFNPLTELGKLAGNYKLNRTADWGLSTTHFVSRAPLLVAAR